MIKFCLAVALLSLIAIATPGVSQEALNVSIIQVIASPSSYDGKLVRVVGYLRLEFEGSEVYLHREDSEQNVYKNGVWVDLSREELKRYSSMDRKYVIIEGAFDSKRLGHMGSTSGTLTKIQRLDVWPITGPKKTP